MSLVTLTLWARRSATGLAVIFGGRGIATSALLVLPKKSSMGAPPLCPGG